MDGFNSKTRSVPWAPDKPRPLLELPKHQKHVGDLAAQVIHFLLTVQNKRITLNSEVNSVTKD